MEISRKSLAKILALPHQKKNEHRLGPAQKERLRTTCLRNQVGFVELPKSFIFFAPTELEELKLSMTLDSHEKDISRAIDHFAKLTHEAAEEEYESFKFPTV